MNVRDRYLFLVLLGMLMLPMEVNAAAKLPVENKATVSAVITNPEHAKKTNPVILEVQRGKIIDQIIGDVDGDGKDEEVLLMGNKIVKDSYFMGELYVIVKDLKDGKIKAYIRPQNCGGYNSFLTLADVTGDGIDDVIITAPTGGSGDTVDLRVIDFGSGEAKEIFTKENNSGIAFVGKYLPNYKAELSFPTINKNIVVDLSGKKDLYNNFNVYDAKGQVKNSGEEPYLQDFFSAMAIDSDGDGTEELLTIQRIVGPTNMDTLGYIRTVWKYAAGNWQEKQIDFKMNLLVKNNYSSNADIVGPGGYLIRKQNMEIDNNLINYPHVSKMGIGYQQGRLNGQIETFIRKEISGISTGDQVQMDYEIKYAGNKWLSVLFTGVKTKDYKSSKIMQAFNFNMETGESISLENLLDKQAKFWVMVKEETTKKGFALNKAEVQGFYYDGDCLVLLSKGKEAFALTKKSLELYLRKDKTDKVLTK